MCKLSLSEAAHWMNATLIGKDCEFTGVATDSRFVLPGDLFVALPGARVDGHHFISEAQSKGAVAALVSQPVESTLPLLQVNNTVQALGSLAKAYRSRFTLPMAAITGSCGKTTVKEMLAGILSIQGPVLANKGNLNTDVGLPLTLMRLEPTHQSAVIEMGARQKGDIAYLMGLAMPTVSLITNVGVAHLEIFGSELGIAEAKGEIFTHLSSTGIAVINQDDAYAAYWKSLLKGQKVVTFGLEQGADIRAKIFNETELESTLELQTDIGNIEIRLLAPGVHNCQNALAAAATARSMGISLEDIKRGLEQFTPVSGRLQRKRGLLGVDIIDDTYNANPVSMRAALSVLSRCSGQTIFVMGDMFELGDTELLQHQEIGQFAKDLKIDAMLGIGTLTKSAIQAFGKDATHYQNKEALIEALRSRVNANTTVLIKGSRSMHMEEVVMALMDSSKETHSC